MFDKATEIEAKNQNLLIKYLRDNKYEAGNHIALFEMIYDLLSKDFYTREVLSENDIKENPLDYKHTYENGKFKTVIKNYWETYRTPIEFKIVIENGIITEGYFKVPHTDEFSIKDNQSYKHGLSQIIGLIAIWNVNALECQYYNENEDTFYFEVPRINSYEYANELGRLKVKLFIEQGISINSEDLYELEV